MSRKNRPANKDMYWFAHGGAETDQCLTQRNGGDEDENELNSFMGKNISDRRGIYEEQKSSCSRDISLTDGSNSSGPPSLERDDRLHAVDKRTAVEERRKLLWEAEQERNDAVMRKHMEREAALEARRNAQRSNISFAFGSSIPRNVETLQVNQSGESDIMSRSFSAGGSSHRGEDIMTRSMTASISAPRGRRKNDLMPTVPYERNPTPRVATSSSSRRRSVSMTRLDQLALPRRHYVEATKANSTTSSGASSMLKDGCSPNRPLSSASEHSGGKVSSNVTRRMRTAPRKPRPVSIAGTIPDQKQIANAKSNEVKLAPIKRTYTPLKKSTPVADVKKAPSLNVKSPTTKSAEKSKPTPRPSAAPVKVGTPKSATPKQTTDKTTPKPKKPESKLGKATSPVNSTPKMQSTKNSLTNKKKTDLLIPSSATCEVQDKSVREEKSCSPPPDSDTAVESDKNNKRIISEEEARAALAEKRRLAREQAEREAELERQRQEELRRLEEERLRQEEEEQRKLEEEHLRLLEEHRRQEEEKLRKAIEDQEQKEEEERAKRDEEMRMKAEQERKSKEEAEKLRLELEEKLRKEEEERAERKKRLEKIMSRTRGKSSGTSPSGSISGSDHLDSGDNQQEGFSSGANSLESNEGGEPPSEPLSSDDAMAKMEVSSGGNSIEANLTYEFGSNDVSLNSNDLMLPVSETASQENSIVLGLEKETLPEESVGNTESSDAVTPMNLAESNSGFPEDLVESATLHQEMVSSENEAAEIQSHTEGESDKMEQFNIKSDEEVEVMKNIAENPLTEFKQQDAADMDFMEDTASSGVNLPVEFEEKDSAEKISSSDVNTSLSDFTPTETEVVQQTGESYLEGSFDQKVQLQSDDDTIDASNSEVNASNVYQNENLVKEEEISQNIGMEKDITNVPVNEAFDNVSVDVNAESLVKSSVQSENLLENVSSHSYQDEESKDNFFTSDKISGQEVMSESVHDDLKAFEVNQGSFAGSNPFSDATIDSESQECFPDQNQMQNGCFENNFTQQDFVEQSHETTDESLLISKHSDTLNEEDFAVPPKVPGESENVFQNVWGNEEKQPVEKDTSSAFVNQNSEGDLPAEYNEALPQNEQLHSAFLTNFEGMGNTDEAFKIEETSGEIGSAGDNPFISKPASVEAELNMVPSQFGDYSTQEHKFLESEQISFENHTVDKSSNLLSNEELDNVTLIKEEGSENYVGIISSIDSDNLSNNFSKVREQLNNFECASTTDSEESSLESNLSQVLAPEDSDKNTKLSLSRAENSVFATDSNHLSSNYTTGQSDNPFNTESILTQSSIPQSTVNHYSASEVYSNGHSVESSRTMSDHHSDFVQLDGSNILSVDHSKNNIFENVDAIDYSKVSQDPFLVKGSSKQIPGNPFLLQDEQNQVLVTSDFLN